MANVDYIAPVEALHGKLSKQDRYGFAKRKNQNGIGTKVAYTFKSGTRSTPVSEAEVAHRTKFAQVVASTRARLADPSQMAQDMVAFQKQSAYKSLYRYVFNQEWSKE